MVILDGEIEILSDRDTVVTVHRAGGFSGDVAAAVGEGSVCIQLVHRVLAE
jgi:hypothetical protein